MPNDTLRYVTTIAFGLIAIAIALLASLAQPLIVLDKVVVGALLVGGLGAGGVALNLTPTSVKLAREGVLPIPYTPVPEPPRPSRLAAGDTKIGFVGEAEHNAKQPPPVAGSGSVAKEELPY